MNLTERLLRVAEKTVVDQIPHRVTMRDLSRETPKVLSQIRASNSTAIVTYRGVPSFLVVPINPDEFSALLLASAPELFTDAIEDGELELKGTTVGHTALPAYDQA